MSFAATHLIGFGAAVPAVGGGGNPTVSATDSKRDTSDQTTYTYTSCNIGTEAANRYVIVACMSRNGSGGAVTISSATINGVSATVLSSSHVNATGTGSSDVCYIIANVPTGTSVTIAVTYSGGRTRGGIDVYAAYGLNSATPVAYATANLLFTLNLNINVNDGGFVIGAACYVNNAGGASATWTGVTESYDSALESTIHGTSGLASGLSAATPRTVNVVTTGNPGDDAFGCGSAVSFR